MTFHCMCNEMDITMCSEVTQSWALPLLTNPKHLLLGANIDINVFDVTVIQYDEGRTIEILKDDLEGKFRSLLRHSLREE